jgi:hypothetical protein
MLRLFKWLFGFSSRDEQGYITVIYPENGRGIVIHDTLSISRPGYLYEVGSSSSNGSGDECASISLFEEPTFMVNPSTGLPMMDEFIDVGGNAFGAGDW